ncbi:MAG: hypothetical protein G3M70_09120 [Candidatus Nitronauta litoralis]|uniref:Uncharacterized protein n=1 Tax=Candidatus Nitronauta litoralis TaxID=2705533 RepID=A0A7T0G1P4_9BACT|nr:MAG: hypothetical protein G3M70_09120 [Candidatus Nitronauta litoralis]
MCTPVYGEPPSNDKGDNGSDVVPSLELLEYLGEFETEDGEWIDPEELEQMDDINDNPEPSNPEEEPPRD